MSEDPTNNAVKGAIEALYKPIESIVKTLAGPAAEEIGLSFRDSVQAWRLKRQIRLFERVKQICEKAGIKPQAVKMPLLFEIMEKGSLEEDDDLQDIWANMLSNAADPKRISLMTTAFPEILKQLCVEEVRFLSRIYESNREVEDRKRKADKETYRSHVYQQVYARAQSISKVEDRLKAMVKIEQEAKDLAEGFSIQAEILATLQQRSTYLSIPKLKNMNMEIINSIYFDNLKRLGLIGMSEPFDEGVLAKNLQGQSETAMHGAITIPSEACFLTALGHEFTKACAPPRYSNPAVDDESKRKIN